MKTKKLSKNIKTKRHSTRSKKGGLLIMNPETDLINLHLCNVKENANKETPGLEIFNSISDSFCLNANTIGYVKQLYKKSADKWFKFIILNNDNQYYIYIITGARVNKHSVCMLEGLLDVTKNSHEYDHLRQSYNKLISFKKKNTYTSIVKNNSLKEEFDELINNINIEINNTIKCMPIVAAGSGTVNDDGSICINNKSGHYKPTERSMEIAKSIFEANTDSVVMVTQKTKKADLILKYGENYEDYTGICL